MIYYGKCICNLVYSLCKGNSWFGWGSEWNESKGVNIVGVVTDAVDDNGENKEAIEKSKLIHEKTKASYPFLMPDKTNFNGRLNGIQAMPETFFCW